MNDVKLLAADLRGLLLNGPLQGSLWIDRAGQVATVVTSALRVSDLSLEIVYHYGDGVRLARTHAEWAEEFKPWRVGK